MNNIQLSLARSFFVVMWKLAWAGWVNFPIFQNLLVEVCGGDHFVSIPFTSVSYNPVRTVWLNFFFLLSWRNRGVFCFRWLQPMPCCYNGYDKLNIQRETVKKLCLCSLNHWHYLTRGRCCFLIHTLCSLHVAHMSSFVHLPCRLASPPVRVFPTVPLGALPGL